MTDDLAARVETHERNLNNGFPMTCEIGRDLQEAAARIRELEAARDDHALMVAYQKGFSDGKAKAEEDDALSALTPAPVTVDSQCIHMTAEMARNCPTCNPYPHTPAPVTVSEVARERVARAIFNVNYGEHWTWDGVRDDSLRLRSLHMADAALRALAGQVGK